MRKSILLLVIPIVIFAGHFLLPLPPSIFVGVLSLYSIMVVLFLMPGERRKANLTEEGLEKKLLREKKILETKIDFLSAEREISLVLNEDVDFKTIISKVLSISADLFGGKKSEEVSIYLKDRESEKLKLCAIRKDDKVLFGKDANSTNAEDPLITATLEHSRSFLSATEDRLNIIVPLSADRILLGVMKISVLLEGDVQERTEKSEIISQNLDEFAKIVSLAVKTPDLYTRAIEDSLTKLATKRHFINQLDSYFESAKRYNEFLSLLMIDIDHFKRINDTYGHTAGDTVLRGISAIIRRNTRRLVDSAYSGYRYGGEELSVILPKANLETAYKIAERLRKNCEDKIFHIGGKEVGVTVSIGIGGFEKDMKSPQELIARTDSALYQAKKKGRNRTCVWEKDLS
jgi:diguanylate cyclase (GGDEF)-like protein